MSSLFVRQVETSVGDLAYAVSSDAVVAVTFGKFNGFDDVCDRWRRHHLDAADASASLASRVSDGLSEYFDGDVTALTDLPCDPCVSLASQRVLEAMRSIPAGATRAYSDVATSLGYGQLGARFVGSAAARNPIPLIIPCHRVVGKNGSLVGYGGRLDLKAWLLGWERQETATKEADRVRIWKEGFDVRRGDDRGWRPEDSSGVSQLRRRPWAGDAGVRRN